MAKRVVTTRTFSEVPEETEQTPPEKPTEPDTTWTAFKGKFATSKGAKVKVYRQTPRGRQYCFFDIPSKIDEESIRQWHAEQVFASEPGEYELALEIDGVLQDPFPVAIAPQVAVPGSELKTGPSGGMAEAFRFLQGQMDRLEQRLMQRDQTPMSEMVDAMYKLDQMRGAGKSETSLDNVLKCIEIGQKIGHAPVAQEWWQTAIEAVKENGPLLLGIWQKMQQGQQGKVGIVAKENPPQQQIQADPQQPTQEEVFRMTEEQERAMLQQTIIYLKKKALNGSDPGLYIDLVLDNQQDPIYARLISEIADKDFSTFATIDADIEKPQYRPFFSAIYNGLRSVIVQADSVASARDREAGNKAHTPANGAAGKSGGRR